MPAELPLRELVSLTRDVRKAAASAKPLVVSGVLANELAKRLGAGGDPGTVRVDVDPTGAAAFVLVLAGQPSEADVRQLRMAARAIVPTIAVQTGRAETSDLPYVLATDVVHCLPGEGFPIGKIASALARRLGPDAVSVASRLPALRLAVAEQLVADAARQSTLIGLLSRGRAGPLFPLLTVVQSRLVLDLAAAHGRDVGPDRAPELGAVVGAGLSLRSAVRRLGLAGSRAAAGVSGYAATRALGEAAIRRFQG